MNRKLLVILILLCSSSFAMAQRAAVSVDALKWAMATPNVSTDILLSDRYTINIDAVINPFDNLLSDVHTKRVSISPELRCWFKRPLYSHFVGVNVLGASYNVGFKEALHKGSLVAVGVTYGYSFYVAPKWSFTPTVGLGYGYGKDSEFENGSYGKRELGWKPLITKFGFYFSYIID